MNTSCPPPASAPKIDRPDGTIWITQAYLILDEIEFHKTKAPAIEDFEEISAGPFAIDLTGTDPLVPENIDHSIPSGNYVSAKFRFKPIDDTSPPSNLGNHLNAFIADFVGPAASQPPTILVRGCLQRNNGGGGEALPFTLITDLDLKMRAEFLSGKTVDPERQDIVFLADLPAAFQDSRTNVNKLIDEITNSGSPLGPGFLDGRLLSGSSEAQLVAENIPTHFQVFTQAAGTFRETPALATNADLISLSLSVEN